MKKYVRASSASNDVFVLETLEDLEELRSLKHFYRGSDDRLHDIFYDVHVPTDEALLNLYENYDNFLYLMRAWATPSSYKRLKERLSKLIHAYDTNYFKAPREKIHELASIILENADKAPYDISVQEKPTSVYVFIKIGLREARNIDLTEFDRNMQQYIEFLKSLPEVGKIINNGATARNFEIDVTYNKKPYLPIGIVPSANM